MIARRLDDAPTGLDENDCSSTELSGIGTGHGSNLSSGSQFSNYCGDGSWGGSRLQISRQQRCVFNTPRRLSAPTILGVIPNKPWGAKSDGDSAVAQIRRERAPRPRSVVWLAGLCLFFSLGHSPVLAFLCLGGAIWRGVYIHNYREGQRALQERERERIEDRKRAEQRRKEALAASRGPRPSPSLIRSYRDAEEAAASWMRWLGWGDAKLTPTGPDGGIDVIASHAVAQVKAHVSPIGRPEIQQLYGVAVSMSRAPLFFSSGGYTPDAIAWASGVSMAIFRFDLQGEPEPINEVARILWERGAFPPEAGPLGSASTSLNRPPPSNEAQ